jgi:hypothetical protein
MKSIQAPDHAPTPRLRAAGKAWKKWGVQPSVKLIANEILVKRRGRSPPARTWRESPARGQIEFIMNRNVEGSPVSMLQVLERDKVQGRRIRTVPDVPPFTIPQFLGFDAAQRQ